MTPDEAKSLMKPMLTVRHVDVVAAKQYLVGLGLPRIEIHPQSSVWGRVASNAPDKLPLYLDDASSAVSALARYLVARMALATAAWELVRSGVVTQAGAIGSETLSVEWTTAGPGQGGQSGSFSWAPDGFVFTYPEIIHFREWLAIDSDLSDGDLYLLRLQPGSMHPGVEAALRSSLRCFREELHVPAVAMLGAAAEGAWILLGDSLVTRFGGDPAIDKLATTLKDPFASTKKKVSKICEAYERPVCDPLRKASGVTNLQLRQIERWSDQVRESRNALHWNVQATIPNSYEKTAVLLMDALSEIKALVWLADRCRLMA